MRDFHTFLAEAIATAAHEGQTDKAGAPYIDHPRAVAAMVADLAEPSLRDVAVQAAWLHDVVEDTDVTIDDLARAGFSVAVQLAVDSVTRRDGELYSALIERAADNTIGCLVKLCDNRHNTDRLGNLDEPVRSGMARRYAKARKMLLEAERLRRAQPRVTT
jgi:(p)ppGpp synthase/HD superfamily hydrolase